MKKCNKFFKLLLPFIIVVGLSGCRDSNNEQRFKKSSPKFQNAQSSQQKSKDAKEEAANKAKAAQEKEEAANKAKAAQEKEEAANKAKAAQEKEEAAKKARAKVRREKEKARTAEQTYEANQQQAIILPAATQGVYYSVNIKNQEQVEWSSNNLPKGLVIENRNGSVLIHGIPLGEPQNCIFDIEAKNTGAHKKLSIKVDDFEIRKIKKQELMDLYKKFKGQFDFVRAKEGLYNGEMHRIYADRGDNDLAEIFRQERLMEYSTFKSKVSSLNPWFLNDNKYPNKILHLVWFTNKQDPETIRTLFNKHNPYIYSNANIAREWESIVLWVNDPRKIPADICKDLEDHGVLVRSLTNIPELLGKAVDDKIISQEEGEKYYELLKLVYFYVEMADYGTATDIARYLVMFLYGGVYIDGDYRIDNIKIIEQLMRDSDSFFGVERNWDTRLGNAFLASKQYGKVIKGVLDIAYRNTLVFLPGNLAPDYIRYPSQWDIGVIFRTGPVALTVAFAKNQEEEKSKMLEHCSVFQLCDDCKWYNYKIGKHDFAVQWMGQK